MSKHNSDTHRPERTSNVYAFANERRRGSTTNEQLDELARRYDAGEFRGPGEYLAKVTEIVGVVSAPAVVAKTCKGCGHAADHEACNGRVE